jgi:hypothetical protein
MYGFAVLFVVVIVMTAYTINTFFTEPVIRSETRIEPQIELIIKDNQVDTIYVYRKEQP